MKSFAMYRPKEILDNAHNRHIQYSFPKNIIVWHFLKAKLGTNWIQTESPLYTDIIAIKFHICKCKTSNYVHK